MKNLFLHLGANKTGSTAIQEFLRLNAEKLAALGFHVAPADLTPSSPVSGQQAPFFEKCIANIPAGAKEITARVDALMEALPDGSTLIVSAENLSNPGNRSPQLFAATAEKYPTTALLYIRRPDEYLLSSWRQWYSKVEDDFWAWIVQNAGRRCDWRMIIQAWEAVLTREHMIVRLFVRSRLHNGDVIADFLSVLGLKDEGFERPQGNINPSYSDAVQDFVKANPLLFRNMHDDETYRIIDALTGSRFHRNSRESEITHEQRIALLERYNEANNWVRTNYFPEIEGSLFAAPKPQDYYRVDSERLDREKWELAASLIFGLAKKVLP